MISPEEQEAFLKWYQERKAEGLIMEYVISADFYAVKKGRRKKAREAATVILGPEALVCLRRTLRGPLAWLLAGGMIVGLVGWIGGAFATAFRVLDWEVGRWVTPGGFALILAGGFVYMRALKAKGEADLRPAAADPLSHFIPVARLTSVELTKRVTGFGASKIDITYTDADGQPQQVCLRFSDMNDAEKMSQSLKSLVGAQRAATSAS